MPKAIILILLIIVMSSTTTAQQDTSNLDKGKNQIGIGLFGPIQVIANMMEGRPVWHDADLRFWYARQLNKRMYLRSEIMLNGHFNLFERNEIMNDYHVYDSLPTYTSSIEIKNGTLSAETYRSSLLLGVEWMPVASFRYLSLLGGFSAGTGRGEYYTKMLNNYVYSNGTSSGQVVAQEDYYKVSNLSYNYVGLYTQLRIIYPIHQQVSLSLDAYLLLNRNYYRRSSYRNYEPENRESDRYILSDAVAKLRLSLAYYF